MSNSRGLYRIGTGWVYDVLNNTGYKVERAGGSRQGNVKSFIKAFHIIRLPDGARPVYITEVPLGVIRKAIHLYELHSRGMLEESHGRCQ